MPQGLLSPVLALIILGYIIWNTLQVRRARTSLGVPLVLIVVGALQLSQYVARQPLSAAEAAILAASFLLVAIGLGAVRAYTMRVWVDGGQVMRQGTWLTAALWIIGAAVHVAVEGAGGGAAASYLLYLGLTWTVQRLVLSARAAKTAAPPSVGG